MPENYILKAEGISKSYPGVKALDGVSMEMVPGRVLALLGENGAGKSTLIKILTGAQKPDSGRIYIQGGEKRFSHPIDAKAAGISVVYQELSFLPELTVAENLFITRYGKARSPFINWKKTFEQGRRAMDEIGLSIDLNRRMRDCTVAEKQQVEIARAIHEDARILILDEPTSALNDKEIRNLLDNIRALKKRGVSVLFITHKLEEIFSVCDDVLILRDGRTIAQKAIAETNADELVSLMTGREISDMYPSRQSEPGEVLLSVSGLRSSRLQDISFTLRRGEILGVYGLMGSGHLELGMTLFGCGGKTTGEVRMEGRPLPMRSPGDLVRNSVAFLPSDRKLEGLVLDQTIRQNIFTAYYELTGSEGWIRQKKERANAEKWVADLAIKTPGIENTAASLSGGNQQKVVLAKWLETNPKLIILNEPTRGIDVGSKTEIYKILDRLCQSGVSILMITSEMPELLGMSDRILVLHEGRLSAVFEGGQVSQNDIMVAAIGGTPT